ncbi:MAG TPA: geranylgeranyl reductase family protein [bacterium]|nr:geranylgeranyl reductase family protein [bacterium]
MARSVEVLVVGGGPAGAAAAAALAGRGREVLVLERSLFPREKLCGDFIHPYGVVALEPLGVLTELRPHARILTGMRIVSPAGREVFAPFPGGVGLSLSRAVLDDCLLRAARRAGAAVETGRAVRGAHRRGGRWRIRTDDGEIAARILVGADGARSLVARAAGLSRSPTRRGRYAVGLRVRGLAMWEGYAEMHLARGAYCGVSAFPGGEANVTMVGAKRAISRSRDLIARTLLDRAARELLAPFPALRNRVEAGTITQLRAIGPLAPSHRPVVADGVVLVGDAAAHTDPLTGQGVSMALTGAAVAAEVIDRALTAGNAGAPALADYARWHRRRCGGLRRFLRLIDWVALRSPLIEPLARAWGSHPVVASRFLGIIGNADPVRGALTPAYLSRLALACIWRA